MALRDFNPDHYGDSGGKIVMHRLQKSRSQSLRRLGLRLDVRKFCRPVLVGVYQGPRSPRPRLPSFKSRSSCMANADNAISLYQEMIADDPGRDPVLIQLHSDHPLLKLGKNVTPRV